MKKFGLLTTLLVGSLLLTGCNKSVNVENEQERIFACGRSVSEYLGISDYSISWDKEEEAGASFVLNGRVNIGNGIDEEKITKNVQCVVDMVDKSVTILEIDEPIVEEPTYEILEWTGYMGCIGGCEDGSDEEYVEGYYYRYTNPKLGLRITTPSGDGGNYNEGFRIKRETPIFKLVDNTIYSLEYDYASNWSISDAEFIKVYDKDPSISLENLLKEKYGNCKIEKLESGRRFTAHFNGFKELYYNISNSGNIYGGNIYEDKCGRDEGEGEGPMILFLESSDGTKYYKVGVNDGCAPGPCSIFGKVEAL